MKPCTYSLRIFTCGRRASYSCVKHVSPFSRAFFLSMPVVCCSFAYAAKDDNRSASGEHGITRIPYESGNRLGSLIPPGDASAALQPGLLGDQMSGCYQGWHEFVPT